MSDHDEFNTSDSSSEYDVGYGKPPVHTRFKRGMSGNPKGKPRGRKSHKETVRAIFDEKIFVQTPNGRKKITKLEALVHTNLNRALKGDLRASDQIFKIVREFGLHEDVLEASGKFDAQILAEEDKAILRRYMAPQPRDEP